MANIKKSFNFRNGVQVDDDNLKVSTTGLVGIGTTVPTEALDVRGNLVVTGVSSATTAQAGVMTVTTLNPTEIIGAGVSIVSGIVTASSGIITFYGDARFLQGMPTSQWEDVNTGLGVTRIYNTGGNVGIATSNPQFTLQIGSNVNLSQNGVGISSAGDIKISGVATATGFVGDLTGDVTGNVTGNVVGTVTGNINSGIATITQINATNINVSGLSTFAGITSVTGPVFHSKQQIISGMSTFSGGVSINNLHIGHIGNGVVGGGATINTSGGDLNLSCGGPSGADPGDEIVCHEDVSIKGGLTATGSISAQQVSGSVSMNTATLTATNGTFGSSGFLSAQGGISVKDLRIATGTDRTLITTPVGVATVTISGGDLKLQDKVFIDGTNPELRSEGNITLSQKGSNLAKIGVGTISPVGDIHLRRYTGDAEIQVTAETGASRVSLGVESGTGQTNHAELRYNLTGQNQFDGTESFSIENFGKGNFNYMLSAANHNAATGNFFWHKGNGLATTLMTLTNTGRLGIGVTTPTTPLHVLGNATVSGTLSIGNNLQVEGTLNANVEGNVSGNLTVNVNGNANAAAGISTFNNLSVAGIATIINVRSTSIGIATDPTLPLTINSNPANRFFVNANGNVGIKTTDAQGMNFMVAGSSVHQILGVGTTVPISSVDFSTAGQQITGPFANKMFMIPPKVTNAQRGNLAGLVSGAMIYNTNLNKLQVYNGSAWETVTSS